MSASETLFTLLSVRDEPEDTHKHTREMSEFLVEPLMTRPSIETHLPSRNVDFEDDLSLCRHTHKIQVNVLICVYVCIYEIKVTCKTVSCIEK